MNKTTLVIGASEHSHRYSNKAIRALLQKQHQVVAIGKQTGEVNGVEIVTELPTDIKIDTVTLYINPTLQKAYETFLIELNPRRVIFNPGTENHTFQKQLEKSGIHTLNACTLVLLATNQY